MRVSEVMTRNVECTRLKATLRQAAERMKELDVGVLPVCENDRLVGVLTDRDITVRCVADGRDPRTESVSAVMSPLAYYCDEDSDVADAAELMREKQVRRLPVLDREKRLVGIVALGDLAAEDGAEQLAGYALEGISMPASPKR